MLLEQIEKWCRENNTSIFALEKACGLGNATIRGWDTSTPRIDTLQRVSKVMNVPIETLLGQAEGMALMKKRQGDKEESGKQNRSEEEKEVV